MAKEIETARFIAPQELPANIDSRPWADITQTYLSPYPADEKFPEVSDGELRIRHISNHLGEKSRTATVKFGDKRTGERVEIETDLTKSTFSLENSDLLQQMAYGVIKKRRYDLSDHRVIDVLDPETHGETIIEEQEHESLAPESTSQSIIPLSRELAVPIANTTPKLLPSSKEDLRAAIEQRYRRNGKLLISVSGMSGSGKTTFSEELADDIGATLIKTDDFHIGSRNMRISGLDLNNHDHPNVYDYMGADNAARRVMEGLTALIPQYDFATAERTDERRQLSGNDKGLVIVDGLYARRAAMFASLDHNAFNILVDRPPYVCVLRRLKRDCSAELGVDVGNQRAGILGSASDNLRYLMETAIPTYLNHQLPIEKFDAIA